MSRFPHTAQQPLHAGTLSNTTTLGKRNLQARHLSAYQDIHARHRTRSRAVPRCQTDNEERILTGDSLKFLIQPLPATADGRAGSGTMDVFLLAASKQVLIPFLTYLVVARNDN